MHTYAHTPKRNSKINPYKTTILTEGRSQIQWRSEAKKRVDNKDVKYCEPVFFLYANFQLI